MNDSIGGLNYSGTFAAQAKAAADSASLDRAAADAKSGRAEEAQRAVEGLFTKMLVKEMRKGLGEGFFGTGPGADTYADWFDDHLSAGLAEAGAFDLGPLLEQYRVELLDLGKDAGDDGAALEDSEGGSQ
jgi:Rod binding domain-containing protein